MTIRPAVASDVPELVEMAARLTAQSEFQRGTVFSPSASDATLSTLIASETATLLVAQGAGGDLIGMIGIVTSPHPITGAAVAAEVCWWVDVESRGVAGWALLGAAEAWATARGVTALQMIAPTDRFAHGLSRHGYAETGRVFERRF